MKVLIVKVGKDPVWADVDNNVTSIKDVVGGELEITPVLIRDVQAKAFCAVYFPGYKLPPA